jgi:hypothetical protein
MGMKVTEIVQLIVAAWPVLPAFVAMAREVREVADPDSSGGRWIATAERPEINRVFWSAYDKVTGR